MTLLVCGSLLGEKSCAMGTREAYSYAGKCASNHILNQGKIGREPLVAISQVSKLCIRFETRRAIAGVVSYSYSSTGSAFGWAIWAAATDPPYEFDCRARMTTSPKLQRKDRKEQKEAEDGRRWRDSGPRHPVDFSVGR